MKDKRVRILLVDDHRILRTGLRLTLENEPDLSVVGEAGDGREALELARTLVPDVILVDIEMPGQNGIEFAKCVRKLLPELKIILLTAHPAQEWIKEAAKAQVSGCVLKSSNAADLVQAIRLAVTGTVFLAPEVSAALLQNFGQHVSQTGGSEGPLLTNGEVEVLQRIADGQSTKAIADALHLSVKTIEARRVRLMSKTKSSSVAELTKYALRRGLSSL